MPYIYDGLNRLVLPHDVGQLLVQKVCSAADVLAPAQRSATDSAEFHVTGESNGTASVAESKGHKKESGVGG